MTATEPSAEACRARPPALWSFDRLSLDLSDCELLEISVSLFPEYEKAGIRFETWPAPVQAAVNRELERWSEKHADRAVRLVSFAATKGAVYVALHHAARKP